MSTINSKNFKFIIAFIVIIFLVGTVLVSSFQDKSSIYTKIFDIESK